MVYWGMTTVVDRTEIGFYSRDFGPYSAEVNMEYRKQARLDYENAKLLGYNSLDFIPRIIRNGGGPVVTHIWIPRQQY